VEIKKKRKKKKRKKAVSPRAVKKEKEGKEGHYKVFFPSIKLPLLGNVRGGE